MWWTWYAGAVCAGAGGSGWWACRRLRRLLARERETHWRETYQACSELGMLRAQYTRLAQAELVTREAAAVVDQALHDSTGAGE